MLVDHLTKFKGCTDHRPVMGETVTGMQEFIHDRQELLQTIPQFSDPDFAQPERLPVDARLPGDPDHEMKDEWRKWSYTPLSHMTSDEWNQCYETVGQIFTGGDDSDDEEGEMIDRYLEIGKDDVMFANSSRKRKMARGEATLDIDSVLALFTDLSMINTKIELSILANPDKNLRRSVHISHKGIPLHWMPHFHFGQFGHDLQFDLFLFLPRLYNKDRKRRKNNLFNHVTEEVRAEFMDKCLLPAIKDVIDPNGCQSWDLSFALSQAKSIAASEEGIHHKRKQDCFIGGRTYDLDANDIPTVWKNCQARLQRAMPGNVRLRAFQGFQFFINSKGHKHRTHTRGFSELMSVYKEKVQSTSIKIDHRSKATSLQPRSIRIGFGLILELSLLQAKKWRKNTEDIPGYGVVVAWIRLQRHFR
jgi:hypothetical protein